MYREISFRLTGFAASLLLTLAAYFLILHPDFFQADLKSTFFVLFGFALAQSLVQLIFFINAWEGEGALWNIGVFASTVSIIFIVIYFSIWIMNHLNEHMH